MPTQTHTGKCVQRDLVLLLHCIGEVLHLSQTVKEITLWLNNWFTV